MSKLYGKVRNGKTGSEKTLTGTTEITAWVQTTTARVTVTLESDGRYQVSIAPVIDYEAQSNDVTIDIGYVLDTLTDAGVL